MLPVSGYGKEEKSQESRRGGDKTEALHVGKEPFDCKERAAESQETLNETRDICDLHRPVRSEPESSHHLKRDFASFYLRRVTEELADDLDKIRSANDFSESSLPILIHALQQGQSIFSEEEKRRVMGEA